MSTSTKIYGGLILLLTVLGFMNVYLPQGDFLAASANQELPASKPIIAIVSGLTMLILYGGLGYLGLKLSQILHYPDLWDEKIVIKDRLVIPAVIGMVIGLFFIVADTIFVNYHSLGGLPHPPFPTSIFASLTAGIGEEIIFRLFFISFWVWLISRILLKSRAQNLIFWVVAIFSAIAFAAGHLPSVAMLYGMKSIASIPTALFVEIFLLNGVVSIVAAYYFKRVGFLGAVSIHFWCDVVWHVIWGAIV